MTINDGNGGNSYIVSYLANTCSMITPKAIARAGGISVADKVYDATTAAALDLGSASFNDLIHGDTLIITGASGSFSDKNVGGDKAVAISGITLGGADAANYVLADSTASATAAIAPATLTYRAVSGIFPTRALPTGLHGEVSGFVGDDTLANATRGSLSWSMAATSAEESPVQHAPTIELTGRERPRLNQLAARDRPPCVWHAARRGYFWQRKL